MYTYVCNQGGKVLEIRRVVGDRYLIEYFFPKGHKWVTKDEFYTYPTGTRIEEMIDE
jgi:hypothetical protein